jgi:hypothetical protein
MEQLGLEGCRQFTAGPAVGQVAARSAKSPSTIVTTYKRAVT